VYERPIGVVAPVILAIRFGSWDTIGKTGRIQHAILLSKDHQMHEKPAPRKRGRPRKQVSAEPGQEFRLNRANLHERTFERLRSMIVRGKLEPGAALVEAELCLMLNVSRTPLREAVKLLAAQGLVELRQNRSARIAPLTIGNVTDLFEAMSNVERLTAEFAAKRICKEALAELGELQDEIERCGATGDLDGYFTINQKIHSKIAVASGNAALREIHELLFPRTERARYFALSSVRRWREAISEHRGVLEALKARRAKTAGRLMAEHVEHTGREVVEILAQNRSSDGAPA